MTTPQTWLDRATEWIAPRWSLKRIRARMASDMIRRTYDAAAAGRRTQGWRRSGADPAQTTGPHLAILRERARDLVRNNPYAESALNTIVDNVVGWGIVAEPVKPNARAMTRWRAWAESTACDADGRHDLAGLQKLVVRTVVESGEVLVRRRMRMPEDKLPIPMQIQVLEPDFLDTSKDSLGPLNAGGARIVQGIEFDAIGRRVAYWLFPEHPGSSFAPVASVRVPATNVLHIFKGGRPGQVRGVTAFAPVLLRFRDFDEFEDATLMKQKIAACLAVFVTDVDGQATPLGEVDPASPTIDALEPGMITNMPLGRDVKIVEPPQARDYDGYSQTVLRAIATGLGVTYEDLTGNYTDLPFSAARMSRLRNWARVEDWRWRVVIPQFCDPVWYWAMELAAVGQNGEPGFELPVEATWTAPPAPMIDPVNEGLAYMRNIRAGMQSLSDALRERGYNPKAVFDEMARDNKELDKLGLILDSDPRQMTQAGQLQGKASPSAAAPAMPTTGENELDAAARQLRLAGGRR
jgi:lambda family phage portal protein